MAGRDPTVVEDAVSLVRWLLVEQRVIPRVCLENPVGILSSRVRPPDQNIQPWEHGHPESKRTCLWLRNLPLLRKTQIVPEHRRTDRLYRLPPSATRAEERSRTFPGIAAAMARQWSPLLI